MKYRVIKFNQNAWLKPYIDLNADLRKKNQRMILKDVFQLMNNSVFGKTMENVRKHRHVKFVTTENIRNYLLSESNYHTTKFFTHLLATEMKKTKKTNKKNQQQQKYLWTNLHLGLSILDNINVILMYINIKILMYEFWYNYIKPKYGKKAICVMWTQTVSLYT